MSLCVLDASVTLPWLLIDEASDRSRALLRHVTQHGAIAPSLWSVECINGVLKAERNRRLASSDADLAMALLSRLPVETRPLGPEIGAAIFRLARAHALTALDATYVELAIRSGLPLATDDKAMRAAAKAEGVALHGTDVEAP